MGAPMYQSRRGPRHVNRRVGRFSRGWRGERNFIDAGHAPSPAPGRGRLTGGLTMLMSLRVSILIRQAAYLSEGNWKKGIVFSGSPCSWRLFSCPHEIIRKKIVHL